MITEKLTRKLYVLVSRNKDEGVISCGVTGHTMKIPLSNDRRTEYTVQNGALMTKAQEMKFSKDYRTQKFYLKELGPELYKKVHDKFEELFSEHQTFAPRDYYTSRGLTEAESDEVFRAHQKYHQTRSPRNGQLVLKFCSKEPHAVEVLNGLCESLNLQLRPECGYYVLISKEGKALYQKVSEYLRGVPEGMWDYRLKHK